MKKNKEKSLLVSDWEWLTKAGWRTFFFIFQSFWSFLTMRLLVEIQNKWSHSNQKIIDHPSPFSQTKLAVLLAPPYIFIRKVIILIIIIITILAWLHLLILSHNMEMDFVSKYEPGVTKGSFPQWGHFWLDAKSRVEIGLEKIENKTTFNLTIWKMFIKCTLRSH